MPLLDPHGILVLGIMAPAPKDASLAYMALLDILHVRLDVGRIRCLGLLEQGYVHGLSDFGLLATAASVRCCAFSLARFLAASSSGLHSRGTPFSTVALIGGCSQST